jgi:hypothetical protein
MVKVPSMHIAHHSQLTQSWTASTVDDDMWATFVQEVSKFEGGNDQFH